MATSGPATPASPTVNPMMLSTFQPASASPTAMPQRATTTIAALINAEVDGPDELPGVRCVAMIQVYGDGTTFLGNELGPAPQCRPRPYVPPVEQTVNPPVKRPANGPA